MYTTTLFLVARLAAVARAAETERERWVYDDNEGRFSVKDEDFDARFYDGAGWAVHNNAVYRSKLWEYLFKYTDSMNGKSHGHDDDMYCNGDKFMCSVCGYLLYHKGDSGKTAYHINVTGDTDYDYKCAFTSETAFNEYKYIVTMNVPRTATTTTMTTTTTAATASTTASTTAASAASTAASASTAATAAAATTASSTTTATATTVTTNSTAATATTTAAASTTMPIPVCGPENATARCTCVGSASSFCNAGEICKTGQCVHPGCTIPEDIMTLIPHAVNYTCDHAQSRNTSCKVACKTGYTARGSGVLECGTSMGRLSTVPACVAEGVDSEVVFYVQSTMSLGMYITDSSTVPQDTFTPIVTSSLAAAVGVATTNVVTTKASLVTIHRRFFVEVEFRVNASDAAAQTALATAINPGNTTFTNEIKTQVGIKCTEAKMPLLVLSFDVQSATTATIYKPVDSSPRSTESVSSDSTTVGAALTTTVVITVLVCGLTILAGSIIICKIFSPRLDARPFMDLEGACA